MSIFKKRQKVKSRMQLMKRLRQVERILLSVLIVFVGLSFLYGAYWLVFFGDSFQIKRVVVEGKWRNLTSDEIVASTGVNKDDNLFHLSVSTIHKNLESNPWIRTAVVRRKLPDTLWIYAEEHEPKAIITSNGLYYVNRFGEVFKDLDEDDDKDLPILSGIDLDQNDLSREDNKSKISGMLEVLNLFKKSEFGRSLEIAEVNYNEKRGYSIVTKERPMQIYLGSTAIQENIARIDRMKSEVMKHPGRIIYMLADEDGRLIVKYTAT